MRQDKWITIELELQKDLLAKVRQFAKQQNITINNAINLIMEYGFAIEEPKKKGRGIKKKS